MKNKGFISLYGLIILSIILSFSLMIISVLKVQNYHDDNLSYAEIYTINKVKDDLYNYKEVNETFEFNEYSITLEYDDINCTISIFKDSKLLIHALLIYNDYDNYIESYNYI